jgi:hypothetical protein
MLNGPRVRATLPLLLVLALPAPALARDVGAIAVPESLALAGRPLQLNGAGLRSKFFVEVYVGALYLEKRCSDATAILAADEPWAVTLTFRRDVGHHQLLEAFVAAFESNSPGQLERLKPQLEVFHAVLDDLRAGQVLRLHYLPGSGTTITVPGGATATVPGRPFGEAVLRSWLGDHPADAGLKEALLGRSG